MVWDPNLWTIPLLLAGVLTGVLARVGWRYRVVPGLRLLSIFLIFITIWILGYLGEILATSLPLMVWFARIEYIGIVMVGPLWLAFALDYTGRRSWMTRGRALGALAISVTTLVLLWTTNFHGAMWKTVAVAETAAGTVLAPTYGPWFWVNIGFQYVCLTLASLFLLWGLTRGGNILQGKGVALGLGTMAPWLGNVFYVSGAEWAAGIDLTVYGLAVAGVTFGWGLLAKALIEVVPAAREKVVEFSEDGVIVMDMKNRIVDANPAARAFFEGVDPLIGEQATAALEALGCEGVSMSVGRTERGINVGDPPRPRIFDCRISELGADDTYSPGKVLTLRDITEAALQRRALEEGREALEAQLKQSQKLEMVGTMAGGIAHDFNNILTAMRGYAELAFLDLPENSPARDDLHHILQGADRAGHLVRQILTFSRQAPEDRKKIRLAGVFEETVDFLRATLPSTIELTASLDPDVPWVFADSTQMQQVLMNLCSNASDAMAGQPEGTLEIGLRKDVPGPGRLPDHLAGKPGSPWARLEVQDQGQGMDEATRQKIFEPFFTTKQVGRGTGLGMSVVHGIVARHGGWVEIASRPGSGTKVTVWLPGMEPTEMEEEDSAVGAEADPWFVKGRVLVVDDEPTILTLTRRFLEGMGHEVREAGTAESAREMLEAEPDWPDLILTDHTMPGGTGLELVETLRDQGFRMPMVMMTGFGEALLGPELEKAGVDLLLSKPFTREELGRALNSLLGTRA